MNAEIKRVDVREGQGFSHCCEDVGVMSVEPQEQRVDLS